MSKKTEIQQLRDALKEMLRIYCLELKCGRNPGHPCPERISTLQPFYALLKARAGLKPARKGAK